MVTIKLEDGRTFRIEGNPSMEEIDSIVVEVTGGAQTPPQKAPVKQPEAPRSDYGNRAGTQVQGSSYNQLQNVSEGDANKARKGQMQSLIAPYLEKAMKLKGEGEKGTVEEIAYDLHQQQAMADAAQVVTAPLGGALFGGTVKALANSGKVAGLFGNLGTKAKGLLGFADDVGNQVTQATASELTNKAITGDEFDTSRMFTEAAAGYGAGKVIEKGINKFGGMKKARQDSAADELSSRYATKNKDGKDTVKAFRAAGYKGPFPLKLMTDGNAAGTRVADELATKGKGQILRQLTGSPLDKQKKGFVKFFDEVVDPKIKGDIKQGKENFMKLGKIKRQARNRAEEARKLSDEAWDESIRSIDNPQLQFDFMKQAERAQDVRTGLMQNSKKAQADQLVDIQAIRKGKEVAGKIADKVNKFDKSKPSSQDILGDAATIGADYFFTGGLATATKEAASLTKGMSAKKRSDYLSNIIEEKLKGTDMKKFSADAQKKVDTLRKMAALGKLTPQAIMNYVTMQEEE